MLTMRAELHGIEPNDRDCDWQAFAMRLQQRPSPVDDFGWFTLTIGISSRAGTNLFVPDLNGLQAAGRAAERGKQGIGQHPVLAGVDGGNGVHHHKEGEQQSQQVRIGDGPCFVVGVLLVLLAPPTG